jgi:carboxyl-terminal processing protease
MSSALPEFAKTYSVTDEMLEALVTYAEKQGVKRNPTELVKCRAELKIQLKARLAKTLFGDEGLYMILNDDDPAVEKAVQILKGGQPVAKH